MTKVKCRFCGKSIDKESAYRVQHGKVYWYYCNQEHASAKLPRDLMYEKLNLIFGKPVTHTILYKEFDALGKIYSYEKILSYIDDNYKYLCMVMSKDFSSTYAMIRYLSAIFKNSLADYEIPNPEPIIKKQVETEEIIWNNKPKDRRKGMDELLNGLID